jgi:N-methylhydantoinase B
MFGTVLQPGDVYHHRTAGGGGWGDPLDRDPTAVAFDVLEDKVSQQAARDLYGLVLTANGAVDQEATSQVRDRLRADLHNRTAGDRTPEALDD